MAASESRGGIGGGADPGSPLGNPTGLWARGGLRSPETPAALAKAAGVIFGVLGGVGGWELLLGVLPPKRAAESMPAPGGPPGMGEAGADLCGGWDPSSLLASPKKDQNRHIFRKRAKIDRFQFVLKRS